MLIWDYGYDQAVQLVNVVTFLAALLCLFLKFSICQNAGEKKLTAKAMFIGTVFTIAIPLAVGCLGQIYLNSFGGLGWPGGL